MNEYTQSIPPLRLLLAFEAAARNENFTRAARELEVSQPAVSQAVSQLEEILGTRLLDRSVRPIGLTTEGKLFHQSVVTSLDCIVEGGNAVRGAVDKERRSVTVSCNLGFATYWLMPRLHAFQQTHSHVSVNIVTTYDGVAVLNENVDIAIRFGDGVWPGRKSHLLFNETVFPVCSPQYLEQATSTNGPIESPVGLLALKLIHVDVEDKSWFDWQQYLRHFGIRQKNPLLGPRYSNSVQAISAAVAGYGVALGWKATAQGAMSRGELVPVLDAPISLSSAYYLVKRQAQVLKPVAQAFHDWICAEAMQDEPALFMNARARAWKCL